jgi:sugar/nucleoside kinase (ribokinase family)
VVLLTALGDDPLGAWLLDETAAAGVDVAHVWRRPRRTGVFVSAGPQAGQPWCVADAGPIEAITPEDLEAKRSLVAEAAVVVGDANLSQPAALTLAALARGRCRVLLGTSRSKAVRLRDVLRGAALLVCSRDEALALVGLPETLGWQAIGAALLTEGVGRVVLTMGSRGIAVVTEEEAVSSPAPDVPVLDATGAGDAVAAAAIHALLTGMDPGQTAALASAAAAIVLQSEDNTPAALAGVLRA